MIDPGMDPEEIFGDVKLPCELVRRMNNTINARELPDLPKEILKPKKVSAEVPKTLAQVEKSFKYPIQQEGGVPSPRTKILKDIEDQTPATDVV